MDILNVLKQRFDENMSRHQGILWSDVLKRLDKNPDKLNSLIQMEKTGGEPDVVGYDKGSGEYIFVDCSTESPSERRSLCFDNDALISRKKNPPIGSAEELSKMLGIELLTENEYRNLQELGEFDLKTSSWVKTPSNIRKLGGAIFCDRRYDRVFVYHNGSDSYYSSRGFRGKLKV